MKKLLGILFFYIILAVLLLPLGVTLLLGGLGTAPAYTGISILF